MCHIGTFGKERVKTKMMMMRCDERREILFACQENDDAVDDITEKISLRTVDPSST
jgi:hypothetical protein